MPVPFSIRSIAAGLLASVSLGATAQAQPTKPLDPTEARRIVADQEAALKVREAITFAEKLARSHPDKAIRGLKDARFALATRTDVSTAKQTELLGQLDAAISQTSNGKTAAFQNRVKPVVAGNTHCGSSCSRSAITPWAKPGGTIPTTK